MSSIVPYKMLEIVTPDPTADAGLMLNNNTKIIADTLETQETAIAALETAIDALETAINGTVTAKTDGDTLAYGTNNLVTHIGATTVKLPTAAVTDIGKKLTVTWGTGSTVSLTISAQGTAKIADSIAGGVIANTTIAEIGWANITLQVITADPGAQWILLGGDGTWTTT